VNDVEGRQIVTMALRLYVPSSDILNEPDNLLKTKGIETDFSIGESENILKKSHLHETNGCKLSGRKGAELSPRASIPPHFPEH
jgi:hypothetical protein